MNTKIINFSELVNAVANGKAYIKKHYDVCNNLYMTEINPNDFQIDKYENNVAVFKHLPTGASLRVKRKQPFTNNHVDVVEGMPKGKKNYVYVADYCVEVTNINLLDLLYFKRGFYKEIILSYKLDLFTSL